jgi:hypothetical protein
MAAAAAAAAAKFAAASSIAHLTRQLQNKQIDSVVNVVLSAEFDRL